MPMKNFTFDSSKSGDLSKVYVQQSDVTTSVFWKTKIWQLSEIKLGDQIGGQYKKTSIEAVGK